MLDTCPYCKETLYYYNIDFNGYSYCPYCYQLIDNEKSYNIYCRICGKKLKTLESKQLGIGPTCYKKLIKSQANKNKLF